MVKAAAVWGCQTQTHWNSAEGSGACESQECAPFGCGVGWVDWRGGCSAYGHWWITNMEKIHEAPPGGSVGSDGMDCSTNSAGASKYLTGAVSKAILRRRWTVCLDVESTAVTNPNAKMGEVGMWRNVRPRLMGNFHQSSWTNVSFPLAVVREHSVYQLSDIYIVPVILLYVYCFSALAHIY